MVGRWHFLLGWPSFRCYVSCREGKYMHIYIYIVWLLYCDYYTSVFLLPSIAECDAAALPPPGHHGTRWFFHVFVTSFCEGVFLNNLPEIYFHSTPSFQKYSNNIICTVRIIVIEYHGLTYVWTVPLIRRHWRWGARTWCSRCLSSSTRDDHPNLNSESIIPYIWSYESYRDM